MNFEAINASSWATTLFYFAYFADCMLTLRGDGVYFEKDNRRSLFPGLVKQLSQLERINTQAAKRPAGGGARALKLHFRLRAKYPIRAQTFRSRVYEYYDPQVSSIAHPVQLEVRFR